MIKKSVVKNSKKFFVFLACLGLALIAAGIITANFTDDEKLSGRIMGFGSGFGSGITAVASVNLIRIRRKPDAARQQEINENDERFIKIREKSALSTWYVTLISLLVLEFVFLFLDYTIPCYITIGVMFIHCISYFTFLYRNSKKM